MRCRPVIGVPRQTMPQPTPNVPQSSDERAQAGTPSRHDHPFDRCPAFAGASITFALVRFRRASPRLAQDADTAGAESTDGQLNTIIVTANRREKTCRTCPSRQPRSMPSTVRTIFDAGAEITALAARCARPVRRKAPTDAAARAYIRGLGNTDFDLAASQPVSVVMDDVVMENVTLKSVPHLRRRAHRGAARSAGDAVRPQGTPAGIVKIDTVKPGDEFAVDGSVSYGSFNAVLRRWRRHRPACSGRGYRSRLSGLWQQRDNWVDNGFTGEEDAYGAYSEVAGRAQLLVLAIRLSILGSYSIRDLDGQSTLFRANILGPGDNELNDNYDRDTVSTMPVAATQPPTRPRSQPPGRLRSRFRHLHQHHQLGQRRRPQPRRYRWRASARASLRSWVRASSPSPATRRISIDLEQFTQEVRSPRLRTVRCSGRSAASTSDSDFDVTTVGFDFPPANVAVNHTNESWAVFGQVTGEIDSCAQADRPDCAIPRTRSRFAVTQTSFISGFPGRKNRTVEDERIGWGDAAFYDVSLDASVYATRRSGFRAPTIQGRDVAFGSAPSMESI